MTKRLFNPCLGSFLFASAALLFSGCDKKEAAPSQSPVVAKPPPVAVTPAVAPVPAPPTPAPVPVTPADPTVTTKASNDAAYIQEMTQTLNDMLADYIRANKRTPKDINEMISLKIITSIPVIPGGTKKWVIDQRTGKIAAK